MAIKKPNKPDLKKEVTWKDQLLQVKEMLPPPRPLPEWEWDEFKKRLKPTFERASALLKVNQETVAIYLNSIGISPRDFIQNKPATGVAYIELYKKFAAAFYLQNKIHFDEYRLEVTKQATMALLAPRPVKKRAPQVLKASPMRKNYASPEPEAVWLDVAWENIYFDDYAVKIKTGQSYSHPYTVVESRRSFKYLLKYFLSLERELFRVLMHGNRVIKIENIQMLRDAVTILKVKHEFMEQFLAGKAANIKTILASLEPLSVTFLIEVAKAMADDASYFDLLTELQDHGYKPVPAYEIIPPGNYSEDTFIFTTSRGQVLYLIWESTIPGRATYVFTADAESYEGVIQSIYDYIASYQKAKRMKLRRNDEQITELNYHAYITHSSFAHWKEKLLKAIEKGL